MGAMYRLKAYFGMVPVEEMGEYTDEPFADRYAEPRRERSVREYADERWEDRFAFEDDSDPERHARQDRYDDERSPRSSRPASMDRTTSRSTSGRGSAVRGALAMDSDPDVHEPLRPVSSLPTAVPEQRDSAPTSAPTSAPAGAPTSAPAGAPTGAHTGAAALNRITTLQPRSYRDARTIGERYRSGVPVIMNLTELEAAEAKRLVDFAAGLVFALHGGFDKVTNRVFLLTPADVEVSADDARMLAQRTVSGGRSGGDRSVRPE